VTGPAPAADRSRARPSDFLTELFRTPLDPGYAQAARKRAQGGPPPSLVRRGTARGSRVAALVIIGFLLAVAYHSAVTAQPEASRARAGLVADVRARRASTDDLQKRADKLRDQVSRERDAALSDSGDSGESARLRNLEAATGLGRVRGAGVVVRLVDAPPPVDPVTGKRSTTNPGRVLDRDLQDISNELWRLGAEAIAINGERLTATTTIRAAGDAILVDFRPVTAPYEISAIGPDDLRDTFGKSVTARRFRGYVDAYRMQFSVRQRDSITLPAAGEPQLRYAQPPPQPSPSPQSAQSIQSGRSSQPSDLPGAGGSGRPAGSPVPSASGGGR
jgi:uncharacterized protein YlxW (UPF0749 family)